MEKERENLGNKFRIDTVIESLSIVRKIFQITDSYIIYGELEIEPFEEFSLPFRAEYWYLKYRLLKEGRVRIESGEFKSFYEEKNINVIWFNIIDEENFQVNCEDGEWFVTFFKLNDKVNTIISQLKLSLANM